MFASSGSIGRSNESTLCGFAVVETDLGSMRVRGDRRLGKGLDLQKYLPESWPASAVKLISNFHTVVYIRRLIRNKS